MDIDESREKSSKKEIGKKRLDFWYFFLYLFPGIFLTYKLHRVEMQNYPQENTPFKA